LEHKAVLLASLEERFRQLPVAAWLARLEGAVPVAPVNDLANALEDRQVKALKLVVDYEHPDFGSVRQVGAPVQTAGTSRPPSPAPRLGEHTAELLQHLTQLSSEEMDELCKEGVLA